MTLHPLDNPVRPYAWGSHTVLAELQGRPTPTAEPEAELWVGAHPTAPSRIARRGINGAAGDDGRSLIDLIEAEPTAMLGPYGTRLSFLLKVLAVQRPLSLQVHPDAEQARRGYAREQAAGIAPDDPTRSYHDDQPKPELICAVTPFAALCGFSEPAQSAVLLDSLGVPALKDVTETLAAGDLRDAVTTLLAWPEPERASLVARVGDACRQHTGPRFDWTARLADAYPGDLGVLVALLLNLITLDPGEAMYVPPRTLHAYLHGTGVEILASSDNVLRGGLTPKHIDLPELLSVTDFRALRPQPREPEPAAGGEGAGEEVYPAPVAQFRLGRCRLRPGRELTFTAPGPSTILCLEGRITAHRGEQAETLSPGGAVFVPYEGGTVRLTGDGLAFRAAPGSP